MKTILLLFLLTAHYSLIAQKQSDLIEVADEIYKFGDYKDALDLYKQILQNDSSNTYANLMAGKCYLETVEKDKSLPYLLRAYGLDHHISFNIQFLVASSYQLNYEFDKAIEFYNLYKNRLKSERAGDGFNEKDEVKKIEKRIQECINGINLVSNPVNVRIENVGDSLNSPFSDYAPVISSDESLLFFTSRRLGSTGGLKDNDNDFFEDIYFSVKENGSWKSAQNAGSIVNTNLHEACIGLSPDGKELFIYKDDNKHKGDIFYCVLTKDNQWSKPKPLNKSINTGHIENSVSISADGKMLFFSSDRPGGYGGMDIYLSKLSAKGDWSEPVNLGSSVNSAYDDESPFYYDKDQILYFSSKGHDGMGSFDLFKSTFNPSTLVWSKPENLGYPINSPDADIYFVLAGNGKYAYYSSSKKDGYGEIDLYRVQLEFADSVKLPISTPVKAAVSKTEAAACSLRINVFGEKKQSLRARIRVFDVKKNKLILDKIADNGSVTIALSQNGSTEFILSAESDGYVFKTEKMVLSSKLLKDQTIVKTLLLDKIAAGHRSILRNIYFDFDEATLKQESQEEMERLYTFLKSNPNVIIIIEGHTDSHGSHGYNSRLSHARSKAVYTYLSKRGISPARMVTKGYGESKPLASNDDEEEGRELNRRIEFLIVKK